MALVLRVANFDLHDLYLRATTHIRRLMNQAIFEVIWAEPGEDREIVIRSKIASPLAEVLELQAAIEHTNSQCEDESTPVLEPQEPVLVGIGARKNAKASDPGWDRRTLRWLY
jgi:hypothetical protein